MKPTYIKLFALCMVALAAACEGPRGLPGPEGPRGPQGPQGIPGEEAVVIEYDEVHFRGPDYSVFLPFGYEALPSDAVLVYALWGEAQTTTGDWVDIWRLLPQTTFQDDGLLIYNYEHTLLDVELFLEADFSIASSNLGPAELEDWVIRIVVVPGQYLSNGRSSIKADITDYHAVKEHYRLPELPVRRLKHQRPEVKE